jgi:Flp pilus assembly pilin Flp
MSALRAWLVDEGGHTAIEYGLIASLFAIASIGAYTALSSAVVSMFTTVSSQMNSAATTN